MSSGHMIDLPPDFAAASGAAAGAPDPMPRSIGSSAPRPAFAWLVGTGAGWFDPGR